MTHSLYTEVEEAISSGKLSNKIGSNFLSFYNHYSDALKDHPEHDRLKQLFSPYLKYIIEQVKSPYTFLPYHEQIRTPIDYYQFGQEIFLPLIVMEDSQVLGKEDFKKITEIVKRKENAILFSNHQTEADPQIMSLLLEKEFKDLAENMIFVAGDRVITDPLTIPFSKGRNLICIYSKKRIDFPPDKKREKLIHNQNTMKKMSELLSLGGKCIYVAPSGGRDRPDSTGKVKPDPFDAASIEMFWLMSKHASKKCHFFPLALWTHPILPPPTSLAKELGEERKASKSSAHIALGEEIDMEGIVKEDHLDKKQMRQMRADHIWELVFKEYEKICPRR